MMLAAIAKHVQAINLATAQTHLTVNKALRQWDAVVTGERRAPCILTSDYNDFRHGVLPTTPHPC